MNLHDRLKAIQGVKKVYFQPPTNVVMKYPCIRYVLNSMDVDYADDAPYVVQNKYLVTVIDENPLSEIYQEVSKIPTAKFVDFYIGDDLNHWVFSIL